LRELLRHLKEDGTTAHCLDEMVTFGDFNDLIGVDKMRALEKTFTAGNH